jgi:hypothetical protein
MNWIDITLLVVFLVVWLVLVTKVFPKFGVRRAKRRVLTHIAGKMLPERLCKIWRLVPIGNKDEPETVFQ